MNPYGRPLPRRCQCRTPDPRHGGNVNLIREHADRPACLAIIDRERAAAVKVVGAGDRAVASVNSAQGPQKLGEVYCEATEIMDGVGVRRFAVEPSVDRPRPWIARGGSPKAKGNRDPQR